MRLFLNSLSLLVIALGLGIIYFIRVVPKIPLDQDLQFTHSSALVNRGEYLVNHVAACMHCHSSRDWSTFSAPVIPGTEGKGGQVFQFDNATHSPFGLKGKWVSKNITPFNLGFWINGEIYRLLTSGVDLNGKPLHPIMPYLSYRHLTQEDVFAIIAYIKTLPQKISPKYENESSLYNQFILKTIPKKYTPPIPTDYTNQTKRGKYLVTIANCFQCHSSIERGKKLSDKMLSGGRAFPLKTGGTVYSANITPDPTTGIGDWSEDKFIKTFKDYKYKKLDKVASNTLNTVMPWTLYAGMSSDDLAAIYQYLMTLAPISNQIDQFIPDDR